MQCSITNELCEDISLTSGLFDFKKNVLFVVNILTLTKTKNTLTDVSRTKASFVKQRRFGDQKCGDATGYMIRMRNEGACSDLHSAEARYIIKNLFYNFLVQCFKNIHTIL